MMRIPLIYNKKTPANGGLDREYFLTQETVYYPSWDRFAQAVMEELNPYRIVDVGCGLGGFAFAFLEAGAEKVFCFDVSVDALYLARERGIERLKRLDLTTAEEIPAKGDLCLCLDVLQQIPAEKARHALQLLAETAPVILFSAARRDRGGGLMLNPKPKSYWLGEFKRLGFKQDRELEKRLKERFSWQVHEDYRENLLAMRKR